MNHIRRVSTLVVVGVALFALIASGETESSSGSAGDAKSSSAGESSEVDDVTVAGCAKDDVLGFPEATLSIVNNSEKPSDYIIDLMIRQELIQPLDADQLHIMDNFDPLFLDQPFDPGNLYTVPSTAGTESIFVHTAAVENVPQSFADFWKPEYAGRIVMLDSPRTVIGLTLLSLGYDPSTQDPAQLEEAKAKLLALVPNIKLFDSDSPKTALLAGDADLGMAWSAEAAFASQEEPAIQYIYPSEGAIRWHAGDLLLLLVGPDGSIASPVPSSSSRTAAE